MDRARREPTQEVPGHLSDRFRHHRLRGLWQALKGVFDYWIGEEIRIFRVDNPHTKSFAFWEWVIAETEAEHPDVIFLSEAFTRARRSCTAWRNSVSPSHTPTSPGATPATSWSNTWVTWPRADFFRPNFWPHYILTQQLQTGGRAMFMTRYVLAATLSSNCGIYGPAFELMEHQPLSPGSEEYRNSEKYQIRQWDLEDPNSIAPLITQLNKARHEHRALQDRQHHLPPHGQRQAARLLQAGEGDVILVVVNLDPDYEQSGFVDLDVDAIGVDPTHQYQLHDLSPTDAISGRDHATSSTSTRRHPGTRLLGEEEGPIRAEL